MKKCCAVLLPLVIASGCHSTHFSQPSAPVNYQADAHVTADLDIGNKIQGEAETTLILGFISLGAEKFADGVSYGATSKSLLSALPIHFDPFYTIKAAAAYNAVSQANADVIIAPRYEVEVVDYLVFSKSKATVSGYKGTIKRFSNTPTVSSYRFEY